MAYGTNRTPPTAVEVLLPVWGYQFVRQFLEVGLPTLLAPGNIPALCDALPCQFTLMTSVDDIDFIREHQNFRCLSKVCETTIRPIDHIIMDGNYSTTLTLAYAEAVRAAGAAMLDTCFVFLVSDYVMADGSLAGIMRRMMKGASAVQVGNFHVVDDGFAPWLHQRLKLTPVALSLPPRELVHRAILQMHPNTIARVVNFPLNHDPHANRLFWRVDKNTLVGRFYLMHMLCIRPETTNFIIGASCDYSFVPEMSPSGNIDIVTDSDEYFVVEMQPRARDVQQLRPGALRPQVVARSLSEWTTAQHRENARFSVIFHSDKIPGTTADTIAEADTFITNIRRSIRRKPQPHRDHPYWRGAIAALKEAKGQRLQPHEVELALGISSAMDASFTTWVRRLAFALFGRPPHVRPWHPRWLDYRVINNELEPVLADPHKKILLVSDLPTAITTALADDGERVGRLRITSFLKRSANKYTSMHGRFNTCLIELSDEEIAQVELLIDRIAALMVPGGKIILSIANRHTLRSATEFGSRLQDLLFRANATDVKFYFIHASWLRYAVWRSLVRVGNQALRRPLVGIPIAAITGGLFALLSFLSNLVSMRNTDPSDGIVSSVAVVLRIDRERPEKSVTESDKDTAMLAAQSQLGSTDSNGMREKQYNDCLAVKEEMGLAELGLMTNQVWHDDPRRLAILLARYKFVAKMFSGRKDVAEVGCGDAFGTRIVQQEVGKVTAYDFDPAFINDIAQRQSTRWPIEAHVHDALVGPLSSRYEGIYSLDVIEHIGVEDEDNFLSNLRDSLTDAGVLIIGSPSRESQAYASPQSKAGHINCKSGPELKALLERYFENVFMFSMNDEVVHTGFFFMAHYLIAICCGKRPDVLSR